MSSSQNSEKTPSWQPKREIKAFEKFGMTFSMGIVTETRNQWTRLVKDQDDKIIADPTPENLAKLIEEGGKPHVAWIETDAKIVKSYVEFVHFNDKEECVRFTSEGKCVWAIELFGTPDGPILGIIKEMDDMSITLLDPCVVVVNDQKGSISYMPIFNVARTLRLETSAIRSRQAPAEVIVASYPGFILQNRMYKYQLKAKAPFEVSPELDNDADEAVTTETA